MILGKTNNEWSASLLLALRRNLRRRTLVLVSPWSQIIWSGAGWLGQRQVVWLAANQSLSGLAQLLLKFFAPLASVIIAPNQASEVIYLRLGIDSKKIHVLYPPFAPAPPPEPAASAPLILAVDATLEMNAGLGTLLRAFGLAKEILGNVRLIIGKIGANKNDIEWSIRQLGLIDSIQIVPGQNSSWLEPCQIYLWPTALEESAPLSLFQAMALGKAIIASDKLPNREFVEHEKTGLLIKDNEAEALAQTIIALARDQGLWQRLGQAAYAFAQARSADNVFKEKLEKILR